MTDNTAETAVEGAFDEDGNISDENMAAALTGGEVEQVAEPDEATEQVEELVYTKGIGGKGSEGEADPQESTTEEEEIKADILSKNGEYTIPFEKLQAARDEVKALKAQLAEGNQTKQETAETEQQLSDAEDTEGELAEDLEDLYEEFPSVKATIEALQAKVDALEGNATNQEAQTRQQVIEQHFNTIKEAHPDYEERLTGDTFTDWVETQPALLQPAYLQAVQSGTASDIIAMLDIIKGVDASKGDGSGKALSQKVDAALKKAEGKGDIPQSLSDIPGSGSNQTTESKLLDMSQGAYMDKMSTMTAEQQLAALDKML